MQSIQLYIEGQRVDMFKDESVSITQSIQNVKDIGSVFTDFSQSFNVPASKGNNKIFKHYYNYDLSTLSSFNANDLVSATIELNYKTFRKGFIGLNGTQMKNNKAYAYKITFFGETVDLKNKLKETKLSTVFQGVNTYDHEYSIANVKTGLNSSLSSGAVRYPLISHTERLFFDSGSHKADDRNLHYDESGGGGGSHNHGVRYNDLKPALKVKNIIDEIENYADIEFTKTASDDFFNPSNTVFDNLYLWLSRVKGALGRNVSGTSQVNMPITDIDFSNASPYEWNPESQGTSPYVEPYSRVNAGVWTCRPQLASYASTGHYYEAVFTVVTSQQVTISGEDVTSTPFVIASTSGTGTLQITIPVSTTSIFGELRSIRFKVTSEDPAVTFIPTINFLYREITVGIGGAPGSVNSYYTEVTGSDIEPNGAVSDIIISDQMPDIKAIDFLTGIFKMFNLTAYVQDDGKIKVTTLDEFYDSGVDYDITEFVDVNQSEVDFAIPYQEVAFRFQKPNTFLSLNFKELFNKTFGDLENTTTESPDVETTNRGNKYVVQLPFGKMLYERLNDLDTGTESEMVYGYCVDKDQNPTNIQPLILSITNTTTGYDESLSFYNGTSTGTAAKLTSYNRPSNTIGTTQSIHFGEEVDEYTKEAEDDSLFENYYKNYIVETFNQRRRIVKIKAYLPLRILLNYKLADRFVINNRRFKINSVRTNLATGESNIELLNEV